MILQTHRVFGIYLMELDRAPYHDVVFYTSMTPIFISFKVEQGEEGSIILLNCWLSKLFKKLLHLEEIQISILGGIHYWSQFVKTSIYPS